MNARKGPVMLEVKDLDPGGTPAQAAPVPDFDQPTGAAMQRVTAIAARPRSWLSRVFWLASASLIGLMASITAWDFVENLLVRNLILGRISLGLIGVILLVFAIIILRELAGFARMRRLDGFRAQTVAARNSGQRDQALKSVHGLAALYAGREELRWARQTVKEREAELLDADALLDLAELEMMAVLDSQARAEVEIASRQVAAATALIPMALADVLIALGSNVSMVRRIAGIYGGRAGVLGSWRLLRAVAAHLVATGAMAIGDDLIGSVAGGGMVSKISRRFGEGVINGALTARVGIAAMEVCRPMPFEALKKPRVTSVVKAALAGMFGKSE
ncbi:MAG: TIGR01620 family protein [Rhodobacteraceae bacterium]|nr:TIGR01620 family protein [Paracoccaceae bacterium]